MFAKIIAAYLWLFFDILKDDKLFVFLMFVSCMIVANIFPYNTNIQQIFSIFRDIRAFLNTLLTQVLLNFYGKEISYESKYLKLI